MPIIDKKLHLKCFKKYFTTKMVHFKTIKTVNKNRAHTTNASAVVFVYIEIIFLYKSTMKSSEMYVFNPDMLFTVLKVKCIIIISKEIYLIKKLKKLYYDY